MSKQISFLSASDFVQDSAWCNTVVKFSPTCYGSCATAVREVEKSKKNKMNIKKTREGKCQGRFARAPTFI